MIANRLVLWFLLFSTIMTTGCAYSITDIDVSHTDKTCVRQCAATYSLSVSGGNQIGFKTETLRASKEAYAICINTCPAN
ncbi:MAG: hypothetical protein PHV62_01635 [Sulfuricurvum sp.]|nr:hypothetical protein [Sulfuricurvum sp.]